MEKQALANELKHINQLDPIILDRGREYVSLDCVRSIEETEDGVYVAISNKRFNPLSSRRSNFPSPVSV